VKDKRKYKFNELFFLNVNPISSYWAGFIAADGCILSDRKALKLKISTKDIEHLELFKKQIEANHPIKIRKQKSYSSIKKGIVKFTESCQIVLFSNRLINDLFDNFNITPRKTFTYVAPNLDDENMRHFLRGYIDGDGCVHVYSKIRKDRNVPHVPVIEILGTKETLSMFLLFISKVMNTNFRCKITKPSGCYSLRIAKKSKELGYYLISDTDLYLRRKWECLKSLD